MHLFESISNNGIGFGTFRVWSALLGLLAATDFAWGADMSVPAAPVPLTWTGAYIGVNAGYSSTTATNSVSGGGLNGSGSQAIPGFVGGGQVGFNYQIGSIVLGAEADFDGTTTTKSIAAGPMSGTEQIPWLGTLRARAGIAFDRFLVYRTGSAAGGEFVYNLNLPTAGVVSTAVTSGALTAGGGVEVALSDSWSARAEYLYVDTGTINAAFVGPTTVTSRAQDNIVRAGLNLRLPIAW